MKSTNLSKEWVISVQGQCCLGCILDRFPFCGVKYSCQTTTVHQKFISASSFFQNLWVHQKSFRRNQWWHNLLRFKLCKFQYEPYIYITISTFTSVRPSGGVSGVGVVGVGVPLSIFKFLQSYDKVSLIKVAWYVLRVKNMHSRAPPDPWGPWDEEKPSYIHYDIRREEVKQSILKLASVFHHLPSVGPKQLCALAHLGCTHEADNS